VSEGVESKVGEVVLRPLEPIKDHSVTNDNQRRVWTTSKVIDDAVDLRSERTSFGNDPAIVVEECRLAGVD